MSALADRPPPEWEWQHRGIVALTGVTCLVWADRSRFIADVHLEPVWPILFLAAAAACLLLAARPNLDRARPVAGALVVGGCTARAVTLYWAMVDGTTTITDPRAQLALFTWLFVAALVGWVFTYGLPR